jgi:hypothetical protein
VDSGITCLRILAIELVISHFVPSLIWITSQSKLPPVFVSQSKLSFIYSFRSSVRVAFTNFFFTRLPVFYQSSFTNWSHSPVIESFNSFRSSVLQITLNVNVHIPLISFPLQSSFSWFILEKNINTFVLDACIL